MSAPWVLIGVPSSAGAHHAGQERAPSALRAARLMERLREAGVRVSDGGDLPQTPFRRARGPYRNLEAVVGVAGAVRDAVAKVIQDGARPLAVGGDCTITLGAVAGFGPDVRLVYVDGDTDLGPLGNADTPGSGILDSTGVCHLLGEGAPALASIGGRVPLLAGSRLALVGGDPRETTDAGRAALAERGVSVYEGPVLAADPAAVARAALTDVSASAGPLLVHFDVDVIDSGELPLANFPHYGSGTGVGAAGECLRELCQSPTCAGLVLTEVNPTHDATGELIDRYIDMLVAALA